MDDLDRLDTYRKMLRINRNRLDDELEIQSEMMDRISTRVIAASTRASDAKDSLGRTESRLFDDVKESETRVSNPAAEARVKRDPERIKAWTYYQRAREEHEAWTALFEAWRQRGYSIKTLADLYAANYFSLSSAQARVREVEPDHQSRQAIRQESGALPATVRRRTLT